MPNGVCYNSQDNHLRKRNAMPITSNRDTCEVEHIPRAILFPFAATAQDIRVLSKEV